MDRTNLAAIPTEIVELIAYYAVASDDLGPPSVMISLLSTCRSLHYSLTFENNHSLYADIFRAKFDVDAPLRRFSNEYPSRTSPIALSLELRARFNTLKYMREVVRSRSCHGLSVEERTIHLWTIYFMCIESDEKNARQLLEYGQLQAYVQICLDQFLFPWLNQNIGFLPDTVDLALIIWIVWFVTTWDSLFKESRQFETEMIALLRPIVFANFRYNGYFAPWMFLDLPRKGGDPDHRDRYIQTNSDRYVADTDPADRSCVVNVYGGSLRLTPPLLMHGAMLSYFTRLELRTAYENGDVSGIQADSLLQSPNIRLALTLKNLQDSRKYDLDFLRLRECQDPQTSPRDPRLLVPGMFSGDWEGRFAFTDFDSFRDMLDGDDDAIHSATIAQQPQVWTIREHHYYPQEVLVVPDSPSTVRGVVTSVHNDPPVIATSRPVPPGPSLTAHLPQDLELVEVPAPHQPHSYAHISNSPISPLSPSDSVTGPTLQATFRDDSTGEKLQSTYLTWTPSDLKISVPSALRNQVTIDHFKSGPTDNRLRHEYADPYGFSGNYASQSSSYSSSNHEDSNMHVDEVEERRDFEHRDIILTGKGHSAWGPFLLKGRVRQWDGMINIVKTYANADGRGTWLYRGYVLSSGIWIGRWRDTMTEEGTNGYEGVFAMTRRTSALTNE